MKRERGTDQSSDRPSREPTPFVAGDDAASDVLRAAMHDYRADLDEAAAWRRLAPSLRSRAVPHRLSAYLAMGLAAGVAFLFLNRSHTSIEGSGAPGPVAVAPQAPAPLPAVREETAKIEERAVVRPTALPRALGEGKTRLSDGSVVRVATGSDASVRLRAEQGTT